MWGYTLWFATVLLACSASIQIRLMARNLDGLRPRSAGKTCTFSWWGFKCEPPAPPSPPKRVSVPVSSPLRVPVPLPPRVTTPLPPVTPLPQPYTPIFEMLKDPPPPYIPFPDSNERHVTPDDISSEILENLLGITSNLEGRRLLSGRLNTARVCCNGDRRPKCKGKRVPCYIDGTPVKRRSGFVRLDRLP